MSPDREGPELIERRALLGNASSEELAELFGGVPVLGSVVLQRGWPA